MADTRMLAAKICELCAEKWPDEFQGKYAGARENFRDWLNEKTGLQVDHIIHKEDALNAWISAIEGM